ncbi:hypothetical protein SASPL_146832 [Salvia splendens]|uniref:non-specific serine/threonine protein kinase n=1 Tax=Salvia splendens TaxID=180675 RepID=A0A8X8Z5Y3_SALSN|nr:hypothetical protein SASPL_146832 [Salvia splendens]
MKGGFLPLILVVLFGIPSCVVSQFETCRQPFRCGVDIPYPFYGADRPVSCGAEGYEIICRDNIPLINISSLLYRVLEINNLTRTLRVARDDLWNDPCGQTQQPLNTTLDTTLFSLDEPSNDQNISLLYGCTVLPSQARLPNLFDCSGRAAFFFTTPVLISSFTCTGSEVTVWVNQSAATSLESNLSPDSSAQLLRTSIQGGFSIQWSADNQNCQRCLDSDGACGSDGSSSFVCHCVNNTSVPSTCSIGNNSFISLPHHCIYPDFFVIPFIKNLFELILL